jgi:hypothetical protein
LTFERENSSPQRLTRSLTVSSKSAIVPSYWDIYRFTHVICILEFMDTSYGDKQYPRKEGSETKGEKWTS